MIDEVLGAELRDSIEVAGAYGLGIEAPREVLVLIGLIRLSSGRLPFVSLAEGGLACIAPLAHGAR